MISLPVPHDIENRSLYQLLQDILRRAVDGTSISYGLVSVIGADIKVSVGGAGFVMISRGGLSYGRILLENPDSNGNLVLSVDPITAPTGTNAADIEVLGIGGGLVLPCRNGSVLGRIILEDGDVNGNIVISCDPGVDAATNKDIEVQTAGFGFVIPSRDGTKYGRLMLENPDSNGNLVISVDPL